jgi:protein TonB
VPRLTPSIAISAVFHAALLALALWLMSRQEPAPEIRIGSVPVTIVSDVVREAAPTPSPSEELFDEVTPDAAEAPETEATESPTPAPPTPTPPRQTPPRTPTQPQRPPQNPTRPPQTPPRQPPSQPQRPPRESLDLDNLTGGSGPTRRPPGRPATESGSGYAPAATGPQIAAIAGQIIARWNFSCDVPGADDLTIRIRMSLSADGRITSGPTLVQPQSGSVYRAVADASLRAAREAAPYRVPEGFRAQELPTLVFDTAAACRNR